MKRGKRTKNIRPMNKGEDGCGSVLEVKHFKEEISTVSSLFNWGRKIRFILNFRKVF